MFCFSSSGLAAPIHIQSNKQKQVQLCSNQQCNDSMMGSTSLNSAIECAHLRAASHSFIAEVHNLKEEFLNQLLELQIISSNTHQKRLDQLSLSLETDIPLIVHADFRQFECNDRFMYFSVKTQKPEYFSKFSRVRVTFDCEQGNWSCKCPLSTEKKSCLTRLLRSDIYYKFIWNYFFQPLGMVLPFLLAIALLE